MLQTRASCGGISSIPAYHLSYSFTTYAVIMRQPKFALHNSALLITLLDWPGEFQVI